MCSRFVSSQRLFFGQKLVWNVRINYFWYTNIYIIFCKKKLWYDRLMMKQTPLPPDPVPGHLQLSRYRNAYFSFVKRKKFKFNVLSYWWLVYRFFFIKKSYIEKILSRKIQCLKTIIYIRAVKNCVCWLNYFFLSAIHYFNSRVEESFNILSKNIAFKWYCSPSSHKHKKLSFLKNPKPLRWNHRTS